MRYWEEIISLTLSRRKASSQFLVTETNWLPGLYTMLLSSGLQIHGSEVPPPTPITSHHGLSWGSSLPPTHTPCKKRAQIQLEKMVRVPDKQECAYFRGRFESSQKKKSCEIRSNQRRLPKWRRCSLLRPGKMAHLSVMGGLAPCGAAIAQTGGRRSWDHETGKAVDGRRWKQKETGKCLKSYQRDPAVFSSLPLSIGSLALGLRVLLSRESMEGVSLSLSCSLDQVSIHIELIQPSKRLSSAFHCKGSAGESPCLSTHWDF